MTVDASIALTRGAFRLDVEVRVAAGEVVAVLGPNGAGKTTLLQVVAGLVPIDVGRLAIGGTTVDEPVTDTFVAPERRSVGVVFQDYLLFPHLSALDNVAFGLRERGRRRGAARARAADRSACASAACGGAQLARGPPTSSRRSGSPTRRVPRRTSCRAARRSGSRSRVRSPSNRRCCCSTNRSPHSTRSVAPRFGMYYATCLRSREPRASS
jgi:hypothetical protein